MPDQPSVVETLRIVRGFLSLARIAHDQPADFSPQLLQAKGLRDRSVSYQAEFGTFATLTLRPIFSYAKR